MQERQSWYRNHEIVVDGVIASYTIQLVAHFNDCGLSSLVQGAFEQVSEVGVGEVGSQAHV